MTRLKNKCAVKNYLKNNPKHHKQRIAKQSTTIPTMSTKSSKLSEAASSKVGEEEDLGALIYRESQLRKREAAAAAAAVKKSERNSSASTRRATSTRRRAVVATVCGDDSSVLASDRNLVAKRKRRSSADDDEGKVTAKKVARKRSRKICSADGCTKYVQQGKVCIRHGAKQKRCSSEGCTNKVQRRGVCRRHGAYRNPHNESTAFTMHGSAYDETTANFFNRRTSAVSRGQNKVEFLRR